MTALNQQYVSEYGWAITLPPGWEPLDSSSDDALVLHRPVVFASPDNWSHCLTWMVAAGPTEPGAIEKFVTITIVPGPLDPTEAGSIANRIFATIGDVDDAEVVELEDGSPALELTETTNTEPETKRGYQLLMPVYFGTVMPSGVEQSHNVSAPGKVSRFQRLCFYAPAESFDRLIAAIRQAARSFHYLRPFGIEDQ